MLRPARACGAAHAPAIAVHPAPLAGFDRWVEAN